MLSLYNTVMTKPNILFLVNWNQIHIHNHKWFLNFFFTDRKRLWKYLYSDWMLIKKMNKLVYFHGMLCNWHCMLTLCANCTCSFQYFAYISFENVLQCSANGTFFDHVTWHFGLYLQCALNCLPSNTKPTFISSHIYLTLFLSTFSSAKS